MAVISTRVYRCTFAVSLSENPSSRSREIYEPPIVLNKTLSCSHLSYPQRTIPYLSTRSLQLNSPPGSVDISTRSESISFLGLLNTSTGPFSSTSASYSSGSCSTISSFGQKNDTERSCPWFRSSVSLLQVMSSEMTTYTELVDGLKGLVPGSVKFVLLATQIQPQANLCLGITSGQNGLSLPSFDINVNERSDYTHTAEPVITELFHLQRSSR